MALSVTMPVTMAGAEIGGGVAPDVEWQESMRPWLQALHADPQTDFSTLLTEAWNIIEPAAYEQRPDEVALLEDVKPLLTRVALMDAHAHSPTIRAKIDAEIDLANWDIFGDMAQGQSPSSDSLTTSQETLGAMLTELTGGAYTLSTDKEHRGVYTKTHDILGIALVNRRRDPECFMIPAPPYTHRNFWDNKGRSMAHNTVLVRGGGDQQTLTPVYALPTIDGVVPVLAQGRTHLLPIGEIARDASGDPTPQEDTRYGGEAFIRARIASTGTIAKYVAWEADPDHGISTKQKEILNRASDLLLQSLII